MSARKLRAAVVGTGHLGKHHARIYHELGSTELVGVADSNEQILKAITEKYGCPGHRDYKQLFGQVDLVSIAVPTTDHYRVALDFLSNGINVLVEKPITATAEQGKQLIEVARSKGLVLMVGQSERFNPAISAASKVISNPRFIEIHRLGSFSSRATDVDVVLDLMIHDLDLILNWVKSEVTEIRAAGVPVLTKRIDIANARIEFKSGCIANLTASRISMKATRKVRVFQQNAYISIDCLNQEISCFRKKTDGNFDDNPMSSIELVPFSIEKVEPLTAEISSFVESIRNDDEPPVPGEAGLKALELCERIASGITTSNLV
jgi:predicted dehydrogenase